MTESSVRTSELSSLLTGASELPCEKEQRKQQVRERRAAAADRHYTGRHHTQPPPPPGRHEVGEDERPGGERDPSGAREWEEGS